MDVEPEEGNLRQEVEYGNRSRAGKFENEVRGEAIADLVRGRALMYPLEQAEGLRGRRISPVGGWKKGEAQTSARHDV